MDGIAIYIGEDQVDLSPNTTIALTLQVADLGDLKTRNVSYTNQFTVPYTANNDRIYENSRRIESTTSVPYTQQLVKILQNGVEIVSNGVHILKKAAGGYQLFVLFREYGFFKNIQGKSLWDLNGTPFKARYNDPRTYRNTTSGLIHPVCFTGNLGASNEGLGKMPFWYYKDVITQIFTDAGYTAAGAVFSSDKYANMVVNAGGSIAGYSPQFVETRRVSVSVATPQVINVSTGSLYDINFTQVNKVGDSVLGYWDGTSKYITNDPDIPANQSVFDNNIRLNLNVTVGAGLQCQIALQTGPSITVVQIVNYTTSGTKTLVFDLFELGASPSIPGTQLNGTANGLRLTVQRLSGTTGTFTVNSGSMDIIPRTKPTTYFNNPLLINPYAYYADLLPDMSQADFIKDFMIHFGLLPSENAETVTFKSFNEIIATTTGPDYTSKRVDTEEDISFNPLSYAQENLFEYSSVDDITDGVDGSGSIDIDNVNIDLSKTIYTSPFGKTLTTSVTPTGGTTSILCANIPCFDNTTPDEGNTWNSEPGPRLLLVRSRYTYETTYPIGASSSSYKVAYFQDPAASYQMTWQEFLDDDYSLLTEILQKAKIVTRYYTLDESDIIGVDFQEPIFDKDSFFILNTIGPFVPGKVTKINMLKI